MKIIFLGTGGGRHSAMFQIRSTGGILLQSDEGNIHLDPGAGALTKMNEISYNLQKTDAIVVSHCHPDHYSDGPNAIEGMTKGGWLKRGSLYGSVSVMEGHEGIGPAFTDYHLSLPEHIQTVRPGEKYSIAGIEMISTKSIHNDPTNFGMKFVTENGTVSYVTDTEYSKEIAEQYKGSRLLILPLTLPNDMKIKGHMDLNGVTEFIRIVNPELVILNHLGIQTLRVGPEDQAKKTSDATGCPVVAGTDLLSVDFGKSIILEQLYGEPHGWLDFWKT